MQRWTVHLKGAPNRGNNHSAVAVGHRIYYFGDPKRNTMKQMGVYIFNAVSLRWTKLRAVRQRRGHAAAAAAAAVPSVRRGHTAVLVGEAAYVWGGIPYCDAVYAFDVARHAWRKPAVSGAAPAARQHHSAVALGAAMYVFGGETLSTRCTDDAHRLDTAAMSWSRVRCGGAGGAAPLASAYHSATAIGSRMLVFGGWGGRGLDYNSVRVFDAETDSWLSPPEAENRLLVPEGRLAPRAFAHQGELYIFGGWNCSQTLSDLWRFSPAAGSWTRVEPKGGAAPRKPWMCCVAVAGGRVVLFKDDLHILDLSPSLKTLSELAVVAHRLDQSGLPHNVRWELAAMRKTRAPRRRTRNAADGGCVGVRHSHRV